MLLPLPFLVHLLARAGGVDSGSPHEPSPLRGKPRCGLSKRAYHSLRERPNGAVARFRTLFSPIRGK